LDVDEKIQHVTRSMQLTFNIIYSINTVILFTCNWHFANAQYLVQYNIHWTS